jgi:F420-dependent oxidoreductase-like protein
MRAWFKEIIQIIDQGGFDSLWVMDHFFQLGMWLGEPENEMIEGYSTLGFFAGLTENVQIGLMVGGVIYRHPALVVKSISTLDVLSGGRTYFGIGAAWYEHETKSLGMTFPPTSQRFEILEETLQIAKQMWKGDSSPYKGKHFQLPYPYNNPQPLSKPHPPILIGGMGPQKTLRLVAQYGDACNFFGGMEDDILVERLKTLREHCDKIGRNYDEIEKTVLQTADLEEVSPQAGAQAAIERAKHLNGMGFEHVIFNVRGEYSVKNLHLFTDQIIPALK